MISFSAKTFKEFADEFTNVNSFGDFWQFYLNQDIILQVVFGVCFFGFMAAIFALVVGLFTDLGS
jgi:hypothetical protein